MKKINLRDKIANVIKTQPKVNDASAKTVDELNSDMTVTKPNSNLQQRLVTYMTLAAQNAYSSKDEQLADVMAQFILDAMDMQPIEIRPYIFAGCRDRNKIDIRTFVDTAGLDATNPVIGSYVERHNFTSASVATAVANGTVKAFPLVNGSTGTNGAPNSLLGIFVRVRVTDNQLTSSITVAVYQQPFANRDANPVEGERLYTQTFDLIGQEAYIFFPCLVRAAQIDYVPTLVGAGADEYTNLVLTPTAGTDLIFGSAGEQTTASTIQALQFSTITNATVFATPVYNIGQTKVVLLQAIMADSPKIFFSKLIEFLR